MRRIAIASLLLISACSDAPDRAAEYPQTTTTSIAHESGAFCEHVSVLASMDPRSDGYRHELLVGRSTEFQAAADAATASAPDAISQSVELLNADAVRLFIALDEAGFDWGAADLEPRSRDAVAAASAEVSEWVSAHCEIEPPPMYGGERYSGVRVYEIVETGSRFPSAADLAAAVGAVDWGCVSDAETGDLTEEMIASGVTEFMECIGMGGVSSVVLFDSYRSRVMTAADMVGYGCTYGSEIIDYAYGSNWLVDVPSDWDEQQRQMLAAFTGGRINSVDCLELEQAVLDIDQDIVNDLDDEAQIAFLASLLDES